MKVEEGGGGKKTTLQEPTMLKPLKAEQSKKLRNVNVPHTREVLRDIR